MARPGESQTKPARRREGEGKLTPSRALRSSQPGEQVDVLASALHVMQEAGRLGKCAEEAGDLRTAILALDRYARGAEIVERWQKEHPPENPDFTRDPRWLAVWQRVLGALGRFPEAHAAVVEALRSSTE